MSGGYRRDGAGDRQRASSPQDLGRWVAAPRRLRTEVTIATAATIADHAENAVTGNSHLDPGMAVLTKPFVNALAGPLSVTSSTRPDPSLAD